MLLRETEPSEITEPIEFRGSRLGLREYLRSYFTPAVFGIALIFIGVSLIFTVTFNSTGFLVLLGVSSTFLIAYSVKQYRSRLKGERVRVWASSERVQVWDGDHLRCDFAYSEMKFVPRIIGTNYIAFASDPSGTPLNLRSIGASGPEYDLFMAVTLTMTARSEAFRNPDKMHVKQLRNRIYGLGLCSLILGMSAASYLINPSFTFPGFRILGIGLVVYLLACGGLIFSARLYIGTVFMERMAKHRVAFHIRLNERVLVNNGLVERTLVEGSAYHYDDVALQLKYSPVILVYSIFAFMLLVIPAIPSIVPPSSAIRNDALALGGVLILTSLLSAIYVHLKVSRLKMGAANSYKRVGREIHVTDSDGMGHIYHPSRLPDGRRGMNQGLGSLSILLRAPGKPTLAIDARYLVPVITAPPMPE